MELYLSAAQDDSIRFGSAMVWNTSPLSNRPNFLPNSESELLPLLGVSVFNTASSAFHLALSPHTILSRSLQPFYGIHKGPASPPLFQLTSSTHNRLHQPLRCSTQPTSRCEQTSIHYTLEAVNHLHKHNTKSPLPARACRVCSITSQGKLKQTLTTESPTLQAWAN